MEAGTGFEPVMLQAYETAVVTTLPAIILAEVTGFEPVGSFRHRWFSKPLP